jgi:DNA repair protein RadD
VGYTATPFRGNGVWLTDGEQPLFTGTACTVTVKELLDSNHLAPLVRPVDAMTTRIDTGGIHTTSGDYNVAELAERVDAYLPAAANEACALAADRLKWIAFTPTVANANALAVLLNARGIKSAVVCGETPKADRQRLIDDFRAGRLRCLVTVLALATGFDVPDVDCILWLRPTQSPVLYVQGAGRGLRTAEGKNDCLWLDFSDTTERLGPVDTIKGRKRQKRSDKEAVAPFKICDQCGERAPAAAPVCPSCGYEFPPNEREVRAASNAAILSAYAAPKIITYPVTDVMYAEHQGRDGKPNSLRVDYISGLRKVASEWVCFDHGGFARAKALNWWLRRLDDGWLDWVPPSVSAALDFIHQNDGTQEVESTFKRPTAIVVNETGKYPELVKHIWEPLPDEPDSTERNHHRAEDAVANL